MNSDEFSICLADSICANELDMLPYGNENSYHIEFSVKRKTYQIYGVKISSTRSLHITEYYSLDYTTGSLIQLCDYIGKEPLNPVNRQVEVTVNI